LVAGFAGARFAATALRERRFGWIGHSLVGLIAGILSGWLPQAIVLTVVTGSSSTNELRSVEAICGRGHDRHGHGRHRDGPRRPAIHGTNAKT
jgi:hypothetical protein